MLSILLQKKVLKMNHKGYTNKVLKILRVQVKIHIFNQVIHLHCIQI